MKSVFIVFLVAFVFIMANQIVQAGTSANGSPPGQAIMLSDGTQNFVLNNFGGVKIIYIKAGPVFEMGQVFKMGPNISPFNCKIGDLPESKFLMNHDMLKFTIPKTNVGPKGINISVQNRITRSDKYYRQVKVRSGFY